MHLLSSQRIMIVGNSGAGKSTLAQWLESRLSIPVIHLDQEFWQSGWKPTSDQMWMSKIKQLIARDSWIMDGNYRSSMDCRARVAQSIIFLDLPIWICLLRVFKRIIHRYNRTRPDMAPGCPERFDLEFLHYVLTFNRFRLSVVQVLEKHAFNKSIYHLKDRKQVNRFKAEVEQSLIKSGSFQFHSFN